MNPRDALDQYYDPWATSYKKPADFEDESYGFNTVQIKQEKTSELYNTSLLDAESLIRGITTYGFRSSPEAHEYNNYIDYSNKPIISFEDDFGALDKFQIITAEPEYNTYIYKNEYHNPFSDFGLKKNLKENETEIYVKQNLARTNIQSLAAKILNQQMINPNIGAGTFAKPDYSFDAIHPAMLPEMALPVLKYMEEVKPHIVIGCDRGGRLFGIAMHAAWRQTRDSPFPTLDGKIHFARISKTEDESLLAQDVSRIIEMARRDGAIRSNKLEEGERLRIMWVDDWVIGGGTKQLSARLARAHDADSFFVVMCGEGADATGTPVRNTMVSWHDRPEEIGINYLTGVTVDTDGLVHERKLAIVVRDERARANRRDIQSAAANLPGTAGKIALVA